MREHIVGEGAGGGWGRYPERGCPGLGYRLRAGGTDVGFVLDTEPLGYGNRLDGGEAGGPTMVLSGAHI